MKQYQPAALLPESHKIAKFAALQSDMKLYEWLDKAIREKVERDAKNTKSQPSEGAS